MKHNLQKYQIAVLYTWNKNNVVSHLYFNKNFKIAIQIKIVLCVNMCVWQ